MNAFERWAVRLTSLALVVSGFGYMWTKYFLVSADPFAVVNHPAQMWFLKAHVIAAPLFMFALGAIAVRHVWLHIRGRATIGRRSGFLTVGSVIPAIVTGYALQLAAAAWLLDWLELSHEVTSVVLVLGLGAHLIVVARWRRASRSSGDAPIH